MDDIMTIVREKFFKADGGRIGFKKGGRMDQMGGKPGLTAAEMRAVDPAQYGGGMNISHGGGGGGNPPVSSGGGNLNISPVVTYNPYDQIETVGLRGNIGKLMAAGVINLEDLITTGDIEATMGANLNLGNFNLGAVKAPEEEGIFASGNIGPVSLGGSYQDFGEDGTSKNIGANTQIGNFNLGADYNFKDSPNVGLSYNDPESGWSGGVNYNFEGKPEGMLTFSKEFKKGGRVNFEVGGLSEQAQSIYDSWISAGHSSEAALDYLTSRGLYGDQEAEGIETIVNTQPAVTQGGRDGPTLTALKPVQYGQYGAPGYTEGLPGNVQQYGVGRQFLDASASPIGETYSYKKEVPGWMRAVGAFIPGGNFGLNAIENQMNKNRGQPGNYGVAGMDDIQKGAYNQLAGQGMLFDSPSGLKTATGKNFMGKGYMEGQQELYDKITQGGELSEEDIIQSLKDYAFKHNQKNWQNTFKAKQWFEAKTMSDLNKVNKQKEAEIEAAKNQKIIEQMKYHNEHTPTTSGGMTYNQIVDAMVQDRSESMRGRPGGIGGKELMADGGLATMFTRRR